MATTRKSKHQQRRVAAPRARPDPSLRCNGAGMYAAYAIRRKINGRIRHFSLATTVKQTAVRRAQMVDDLLARGASLAEVRAEIRHDGRTEFARLILARLKRDLRRPQGHRVEDLVASYRQYEPEVFDSPLTPSSRNNHIQAVYAAARAAVLGRYGVSGQPGMVIDRSLLGRVPLRWLTAQSFATWARQMSQWGDMLEARSHAETARNRQHGIRALLRVEPRAHFEGDGLRLPPGLLAIAELPLPGSRSNQSSHFTDAEVLTMLSLLERECGRRSSLGLDMALAAFGLLERRHLLLVRASWITLHRQGGHLRIPSEGARRVSLRPGLARWLKHALRDRESAERKASNPAHREGELRRASLALRQHLPRLDTPFDAIRKLGLRARHQANPSRDLENFLASGFKSTTQYDRLLAGADYHARIIRRFEAIAAKLPPSR